LRHLGRWARKSGVTCYRLYDADLPEYAAAVDFYENQWLHIQEYAPPAEIDPEKARQRFKHIVNVCCSLLELPLSNVFVKQRKEQKGADQYQKLESSADFHTITEGGLRFRANFRDYLDTGIFLDNRNLRNYIRELADGKHFLNLFSYTGTASVYAIAGGAASATAVDTNGNYHAWARENLKLNRLLNSDFEFIEDDCVEWLSHNKQRYDMIFLDPPAFSNSKKEGRVFDLQKQYPELIQLCMQHLTKNGFLIFAVSARKFKLDPTIFEPYAVRDLSRATLAEDFKRRQSIHRCWELKVKPPVS